jgi:predicted nuclease with TOPRIM domain
MKKLEKLKDKFTALQSRRELLRQDQERIKQKLLALSDRKLQLEADSVRVAQEFAQLETTIEDYRRRLEGVEQVK